MAGAIIIGETTFYGTWASLRAVFSYPYPGLQYSIEYPVDVPGEVSYKSAADGSGLIRADNFKDPGFPLNILVFEVVAQNSRPNPTPPPALMADYALRLAWWEYGGSPAGTRASVEIQNQLIGETVNLSGGSSFTITSDLFTVADGRQVFATAVTTNPGWVTSIGKLAPIT